MEKQQLYFQFLLDEQTSHLISKGIIYQTPCRGSSYFLTLLEHRSTSNSLLFRLPLSSPQQIGTAFTFGPALRDTQRTSLLINFWLHFPLVHEQIQEVLVLTLDPEKALYRFWLKTILLDVEVLIFLPVTSQDQLIVLNLFKGCKSWGISNLYFTWCLSWPAA